MKCHTMPPLRRVVGRRARSRQSCAVWLKRGTSVRVPSAKVHWCEMKRSYGRKQKLCSNPFGLPHSKTLYSSVRPVSASFIRAHKSLHGLLSPGDRVCVKCRKVIPKRDSEARGRDEPGTSGQTTAKDKNPEDKESSTSTPSTAPPSSEMEVTPVKQVATEELDAIMDIVGETPVRTGG